MSNIIKILHLEDEPSDVLLISQALKRRNLETQIVVANSKEKYLLALDYFEPDIILADHSLPSFNSFEALELLEKMEKSIPVILVTATMKDEFAVEIIKKGAKDYILKDRLERLPSAIENALRINRLELERQDFLMQVEKSERKFRRLVENSANAVAILSSKGNPLYVSPSIKNVLGFSEEEGLLMDISENIHKDHRQFFSQKFEECKENPEKPFYGNMVKAQHKNGEWVWLEYTLTNFLHDSDIKGIVVDFRDVTERKLAEKALSKSEEKYRSFFENSHDGILLTVTDGKILAANAAACKMFQRTEQEIREAGRYGLVDATDPRVMEAIKERQRNGKVLCDINMLRKDGSVFPAELSSTVFRNAKDEELTAMIIRDNSGVKRAEEELRTSEKKYRQLFENSPLPKILYDIHTLELVDVNQAATEHYGYSREEFLTLRIIDFLPQEEIDRYHSLNQALNIETGVVSQSTAIHIKKDKSRINVETYGYNLNYKERNCRLVICLDVTEKNNHLKSLQEKTEKLINAEKLTKLGYLEVGLKDPYFFWSDEVYRIWERKKEELQVDMETFEKTIHPDDLDNFRVNQKKAIIGTKELDQEYRIILPNGKIKWIHGKGKVIRDEAGSPLRFEGSVQDITERKNFLEKLTQSEARYRGLIQSQTNYMIRVDVEGKYTYSNNKFQEDFGWIHPNKKVVGEYCMASIKEYHHQRVADVSNMCLENPDRVFQVEIDKPGKDGKVKTTLWDFIYLKASPDDPGEIQCVGIDITDRVRAENEMRFQANLLDKIGQAVIATNKEGIINYWNKAATTIYGWLAEEVEGKNIMSQVPMLSSALQSLEITETLKKDYFWSGDLRIKRKDGTTFPALISCSPVFDDEQNLKGFIAISSDNTERKNADIKLKELNKNLRNYTQELVTANKGLEQFTFIVSHNLRSPVANIIGLGDLLKNESYPAQLKEEFLQELLDNVKRLDNVVQDLNTILQVKVELNTNRGTVNLEKMVASIEAGVSKMVQEHEMQISTNFDEAPEIETVQTYLYSIFYNLITNSIKYRHPGRQPKLSIASQKKDSSIILTFRDNGLGFDMSGKGDQVFGLYKRFHHHIEGKGMGLFLVKTQVELLGGKITVNSVVNNGSEFIIELKQNSKEDIKDGKIATIYSS